MWFLYRRTSGTTLRAVWWWAVGALGLFGAVELSIDLAGGVSQDAWVQFARYAVGAATFCPMMSLLGAKRPQDRAWQAIVLSLWVILLLPAAQWWLFQASSSLMIWGAWRWFLLVLLLIALGNHLPTRLGLAALVAVCGQVVLLNRCLPIVGNVVGGLLHPSRGEGESSSEMALWFEVHGEAVVPLGMFVAALWLVWFSLARSSRSVGKASRGLDLVWRDFRNLYGVVWSLRITGFINDYAERYEWPVLLTWNGFVPRNASDQEPKGESEGESDSVECVTGLDGIELPAEIEEALTKSFRITLRRFVSPAWIEERL